MPLCGSVSGVVCSSRTVEAMGTAKRQHWEKYGEDQVWVGLEHRKEAKPLLTLTVAHISVQSPSIPQVL